MRGRLSLAMLLGACSSPDEERVRAEFINEYPGVAVISAGPGEGDSDHVYYHVRFRQPPDTTVREVVWGYRRTSGRQWQVFHRGTETPRVPK
jgi:hypothetical protein